MRRLILVFVFFLGSFSLSCAVSDVGEACDSDVDCLGVLFCEDGECILSSGFSYETEEMYSEKTCVLHEECSSGFVCDFASYTCVPFDALSFSSCTDSSGCFVDEECSEGYCIPSVSGSAGITPDNPYLGWIDRSFDEFVSMYSNDPEVLEAVSREALLESRALEERYEQGVLSFERYTPARERAAKKAVSSVQQASRLLDGGGENVSFRGEQNIVARRLAALAVRVDTDLQSFERTLDNTEVSRKVGLYRAALVPIATLFSSSSVQDEAQEFDETVRYSCTSFSEQTVFDGMTILPRSDGTVSFFTSEGLRFDFFVREGLFSVVGEDLEFYFNGKVFSGEEVFFSPLTDEGEYAFYLDSQYIGSVFLDHYGASLLGLQDIVLYTYAAQKGYVHLIVDEELFVSFGPKAVKVCSLEPYVNIVGETKEGEVSVLSASSFDTEEELFEEEAVDDSFSSEVPEASLDIGGENSLSPRREVVVIQADSVGASEEVEDTPLPQRVRLSRRIRNGSSASFSASGTGMVVFDAFDEWSFSLFEFLFDLAYFLEEDTCEWEKCF